MLQETLKKLNFSDKEIDLYLAILKNGKITPTDLSKLTGINRSTVYSVSQELIKKGIINEDLGGATRYLAALPPEDLENIINKDQAQLEKKKQLVNSAIKELKLFSSGTKYAVPKVRFIAEEELENFLYKQAPVWDESILKTKSKWMGFQDHTYAEHFSRWIDWYWERAPKDLELQLLTNQSDIEKIMKKRKYSRRHMKFLKKSDPFTASTWVCGEYLIMLITNERPHYAIEIHNAELAKNQREIFKMLWELVK